MPVKESGPRHVLCWVCLDEGCEWCPAVDAVEEEAPEARLTPGRPAA